MKYEERTRHTHHAGDTGAANVNVENTDFGTLSGKVPRELGRDTALSYSSLSRENKDLVFDVGETVSDLGKSLKVE